MPHAETRASSATGAVPTETPEQYATRRVCERCKRREGCPAIVTDNRGLESQNWTLCTPCAIRFEDMDGTVEWCDDEQGGV